MIKKIFIGLAFIIVILLLVMLYYCDVSERKKVNVSLLECVDGDTVWFNVNQKRVKVRFLGINAPEIAHEESEAELYGDEAKTFVCSTLENANSIYLEYDSASDLYDKYDRLLAWVFVDGKNLNEFMVLNGYAEVKYVYSNYRYVDDLCMAQEKAYQRKVGIWESNRLNYTKNYCNKKRS